MIGPDEPDVFFSIWCNGTRAPCHEKELSTAAANVATGHTIGPQAGNKQVQPDIRQLQNSQTKNASWV